MLRYMLDTDICSYVMKRSHDTLPKYSMQVKFAFSPNIL